MTSIAFRPSFFPDLPAAGLARAGLLAAGLLAAGAAAQAAFGPKPTQPGEAVATAAAPALAAWIAAETDLPLPDALPGIAFESRETLARLFFGPDAKGTDVEAVYDMENNRILLAEDWTGETPAQLSVLVHEMVHHMEQAAEVSFRCPAEREKTAFDVQSRWLEAFGGSLEQDFQIDGLTLMLRTSCDY